MPKKQPHEESERETPGLERRIVPPSKEASKSTGSDFLSGALAKLPVMACLINREGALTQVSDVWLEKMGYGKTEVIGRRATDFLTEKSKMCADGTMAPECVEKQRLENLPYQFVTKDGAVIDVLLSVTALRGSSEAFESSVITMMDITELKRIERELTESGKKYRDLFEKGSDLLCIHDFAGNLLETNLSYKKKYALGNEDLKGVNIKDFIPDKYKADFDQYLERIKDKGEDKGFLRVITKTGDKAILEYSNKVMYDDEGRPVAVQGTARDVTARLMAERALKKSEQRFALALKATQDAVWDWDLLTNSFYYSPQWWNQIGYKENELKADPDLWRRMLHPDDLDRAGRAVERAIQDGASFKVECRLLHKNGHYVPILARGYVLRDERGKAVRVAGANTDLTERKHLEATLRRAHQELEIKVQERTSELAKSNEALKEYAEKLEKLNAELGDFVFVASHDLQEPLRKIQTFCDLVMGRCGSLLDMESEEYLNVVVNSATQMRRRLQDLVRYKLLTARLEKMQLIDLSNTVRMAADFLKDDFEICEGVLETGSLGVIEADEDQMVQLFQNLLDNALKFRGNKSPRIRISARMEDKACEIRIEDNGIGFEAQYSERIFKPFQKLHSQKEYEGSGMGLAICRKIVESHGGKIWAESEPEKGSTFIIRLPVKHEEMGSSICNEVT